MAETTLREQLDEAVGSASEAEAAEIADGEGGREASHPPVQDEPETDGEPGEARRYTPAPVEPAEAAPVASRKAPSSWKKDYWDDYARLDPRLQDYIERRERDFANGVSTYRQEAERSRELWNAIAPFERDLQAHGISPSQWVSNLGRAHHSLVNGNAQKKLAMFQRLAADYQVPAQLAVQDAKGQWQLMERATPGPAAIGAVSFGADDIRRVVQQQLTEQGTRQTFSQFLSEAPAKYEHFDAVRNTMAGLLQAGVVQDLQDAYDAAIRLPAHSDLYEQVQQQHRQADEARRMAAQRAAVQRARSQAISPRSATPGGATTGGRKGLRDTLTEAVEAVSSGRV